MKIAYYLPQKVFSNTAFANLGWSDEKIFKKTGIRERHVCRDDEFALDLAVQAAELLFQRKGVDRKRVDYVLYCTQSPDYTIPTNACLLQERLGLDVALGALDFNLGCSGFVYGLSLAKGLLLTGQASQLLLITSETYSKYIHPGDRSNRVIFGDGAAATLLDRGDAERLGEFVFGTDGSGAENLCMKSSGLRYRGMALTGESTDCYGNVRSGDNLYMNGAEILRFTLHRVPEAVSELLSKSGLKMVDIHHFVFHQANRYILEALREKMGIPLEKFPYYLEEVGNTVSSTIPILLSRLDTEGRLLPGQKVLLVGFGVGYSWATTLYRL